VLTTGTGDPIVTESEILKDDPGDETTRRAHPSRGGARLTHPYDQHVPGASEQDGGIWDDVVADPWIRFSHIVDAHGEVFGEAAMQRLEPLAGSRILDVGCGLGPTTRRLGELAGSDGTVIGVDSSPPFVAEAERRGGPDNITYVLADAATVELAPVDAVFSRFGVMFFPDPGAAFAHLRSLTRSGGRMAFACWQDPTRNPWMLEPVLASVPVLGPPQLPPPGAPGPFAMADPAAVRALLEGAGWSGIEVEGLEVEQPWPPGGGPEASADVMVQISPPLATALRARPEQRDAVVAAIVESLGPRVRDGAVYFEAAAWIVTATNG
jgi:SAM-dependent methyltransferase